jgi:superfamily I DNA/RNA helicase
MSDSDDKYLAALAARQAHIDAILNSKSRKRIVVAGPGTGKTYLFKRVIEGKDNTLTLSFVNALVDDLSLELCGLSEVRTLHGYALSVLATATKKDVSLFPKLSYVMKRDADVLRGVAVNFDKIFHIRDDGNEHLPFYTERHRYYGFYGYTDVVYAAVKYLEARKDKVPTYDQVVVDEFQDFNLLEVSLIDALSEQSPVLIAGDDDQALYDFKSADARHIRECHGGDGSPYEAFTLPFCSRCTRVIVEATNDVIASAKATGLLPGRIDKSYTYFDDKKKDIDSAKHPHIDYKQVYAAQIPWAIETEIKSMAEAWRESFSILVIAATSTQCKNMVKALREKGFQNVSYVERDKPEPNLMDGLKLLSEDKESNLGWRVVAEVLMPEKAFVALLKTSDTSKPFVEYIPAGIKGRANELLKALRNLKNDKLDEESTLALCKELGLDPVKQGREELLDEMDTQQKFGGATRKLPIKVTTVQSSKGLAADLVFVTYFDDQYFIREKDNISDQDACNLIVAMTRARKKLMLISSAKKDPTFLSWIDKDRIRRV